MVQGDPGSAGDQQTDDFSVSPVGKVLPEAFRWFVESGDVPYPDEPVLTGALPQSDYPKVARFEWAGPTDDWYVTGVVTDTAAGLAIADLRIYPRPGQPIRPGALTNELLRGIPLGQLLAVVRARLSNERMRLLGIESHRASEGSPMLVDESFSESVAAAKAAGELPAPRRGGKPPLPVAIYRRTAVIYLEELDKGVRGLLDRIAKRLSEELGRVVPPETAKDWVQKARNRFHYLTPTKQGRAVGTQAGPQLHAEWEAGQVALTKAPPARPSRAKRAAPRGSTSGTRRTTEES